MNDAIDDGEKKLAGGQHFMLNSTDALKEVLEEYYERTATRFVGWRKTKNFGLSSKQGLNYVFYLFVGVQVCCSLTYSLKFL